MEKKYNSILKALLLTLVTISTKVTAEMPPRGQVVKSGMPPRADIQNMIKVEHCHPKI